MASNYQESTNYQWSNEINAPLSILSRQSAISELRLAEACTPNLQDDVENHASRIGIRIGCGKGRAMMLCDTGLFLKKMPKVAELLFRRGCFSLSYVHAMAMATYAVDGAKCESVEVDILAFLRPRRDCQAIPGLRTFKRALCEIVDKHDPLGVNDEENPRDHKKSESVSLQPSMDGKFGELSARLRKDRASEFMSILTSIRMTEKKAGRECTWGDALMHLARGSASTKVVMNVYSPLPQLPITSHFSSTSTSTIASSNPSTMASLENRLPQLWLEGAGWLDKVATEEWLNRLTDIRLSADSTVNGYTPSESQVARIRGRDGTCRFPGCDVPATQCDIDHIKPYNHENSAESGPTSTENSGPTSTENLHCLCRKHHNLKTHHFWEITGHADNSETWSSCDGTITARSLPTGPLAGFGRQTFDQRLTRKTRTIRELNANNERLHLESQQLLQEVRQQREEPVQQREEPVQQVPDPPF